MPVKIRLQRHGRKRYAYYHIVVADSRSPRDGKFIERLGSYNPNTNPASINLDFDKALTWLSNGAQPTDTCRAILSYKGVLMKKHLIDGVKKGAFDEAEAERRFNAWLTEKEDKVQAKKDKLASDSASSQKERLAIEAKINAEKAEALLKKKSELAAETEAAAKAAAKAAAGEEVADEEVADEATEAETSEEPQAE
ncbi:MAG: 30S ribosomal protein S16 [Marinilabiliaceae bacterium]|nr:30S ribosomal protein S16 [Marinilabiliaceae bacterium]